MLDFSTKWPTKFADKVSKRRQNENCPAFSLVASWEVRGYFCQVRFL